MAGDTARWRGAREASTERIAVGKRHLARLCPEQRFELSRGQQRHGRTGVLGGERGEHRRRALGRDAGVVRDRWLESAGLEHVAAFLRQLRHGARRLSLPRRGPGRGLCRRDRGRLQHGVPIGELLAAAIVAAGWLLILAPIGARRTAEPYVEMIVMVPPRSHLAEPARVLPGL